MTDMVERVARAIVKSQFSKHGISWSKLYQDQRYEFIRDARAVLAAMREPSNWMVQSAWLSMPDAVRSQWHGRDIVEDAYQAAIDAALSQSGEGHVCHAHTRFPPAA